MYVPANIVKRLEKNRRLKKGMDIKLNKTNIRKQIGGSLLCTVLTLGRTFGPTIAKTLQLPALAGFASEGASQGLKRYRVKGLRKQADLFYLTNKEASTVLCSVVKQAGSG